MKTFIALLSALAIAGCTTAQIETGAKQACDAANTFHLTWIAGDFGSAKDKATVEAAWNGIQPLCESPSTITLTQIAVVTAQTAVIIKMIRKAKTNG